MKKAQIQTQVFVYLLSLVIVGLVLLYGYKAITGFKDRQESVSLIEFEGQMENLITSMKSRPDSLKKISVTVPGSFKYVCFGDNYEGGAGNEPKLGDQNVCEGALRPHSDSKVEDSDFAVDNAIEAGTANIFLVPDGADNFLMGSIDVVDTQTGPGVLTSTGCVCIERTGGEVILKVEGLGDGVKISKW